MGSAGGISDGLSLMLVPCGRAFWVHHNLNVLGWNRAWAPPLVLTQSQVPEEWLAKGASVLWADQVTLDECNYFSNTQLGDGSYLVLFTHNHGSGSDRVHKIDLFVSPGLPEVEQTEP